MSDGWKHGCGYGRGMIVRMSDGWSHGHGEVCLLCVLEKLSHNELVLVTCVTMPHLQPAFVSPVNQGRQRQDNRCKMCYVPRRREGVPFNEVCHVIEVVVSCVANS